jgi:lysophospholipase L1-like esterase
MTEFDANENLLKADWNSWLITTCKGLGVKLANVHDVIADPTNSDLIFAPYNADNCHLTALGYRAASEEVWSVITNL